MSISSFGGPDQCLADLIQAEGRQMDCSISPLSGIPRFENGGGLSILDSQLRSVFDSCQSSPRCTGKTPEFACVPSQVFTVMPSARRQQSLLKPLRQYAPLGNSMGLAKGGLPSHYHEATPEGHHPEFVTGHTGFYADGRGTGQSDDIPALLHDGDYVMDAETVSALGDGSSKAGREVLDGFRNQIPHSKAVGGRVVPAQIADGEYVFPAAFVTALGGGDNKRGASILDGLRKKLREHKRAAPVNKIPPKAKSPLEYIEKE